MEFYRQLKSDLGTTRLQELIVLGRLPQLCASIDTLLEQQGEQGRIYCVWGTFTVNREEIRDGVRFTLPACPNALAWTITVEQENITIHCTINRSEHDPDFVASIDQFAEDWRIGLSKALIPDN
ncbi:hypothetical protein [Sedimenticola sp.]|uniref:hypothetical protein n=1 Tax=Sedimenticola sp. TaxID=1940285 RepID=UPI00258F5B7E|nr:hypothetical protein [Sedimenticola sp.]MCW8903615.1 hypothetical protein [Sedimenticola sp.]